jgi:hypothetical protein
MRLTLKNILFPVISNTYLRMASYNIVEDFVSTIIDNAEKCKK